MPGHVGRRNLPTGNTIRAVSSKRRAKYLAEPVLTKSIQYGVKNMEENADDGYLFYCPLPSSRQAFWDYKSGPKSVWNRDEAIDEGGLLDPGVQYSLNKKQRWLLADLLKFGIAGEKKIDIGAGRTYMYRAGSSKLPNDYNVTLVEHHKMNKKADCTSVYSTKLKRRKITPRLTHLDSESTLKSLEKPKTKKQARSKKRTRQCQSISESESDDDQSSIEEDKVPEKTDIRYDIYYPMPANSHASYNSKLMVDRDIKYYEDIAHPSQSRPFRNVKGEERFAMSGKDPWADLYDMEDAELDLEGEIYDWTLDVSVLDASEKTPNTIFDVIQHSTKVEKKRHHKKRTKKSAIDGDRFQYDPPAKLSENEIKQGFVEEPDEEPESSVEIEDYVPTIVPTVVNMKTDSLCSDYLGHHFPSLCKTLKAQPLKYMFDLTEVVHKFNTEITPSGQNVSQSIDVYLLIEKFPEETTNVRERCSQVIVQLLTNLPQKSLRLETVNEDDIYSIEDLLASVTKFVSLLTSQLSEEIHSEPDRLKLARELQTPSAFSLIHHGLKRNISNLSPETFFVNSTFYQKMEGDVLLPSWDETIANDWNVICGICFEEIDMAHKYKRGTALLPCRHWTCNSCWRSYVISQINSGSFCIKCPTFKCESVVDWPTIMSFAGPQLFGRHLKIVKNISLNSTPGLIWCPKPNCGRIITSGKSNLQIDVSCKCGHEMCFKCERKPHWPATCKQAEKYIEHLQSTGDLAMVVEKHVSLSINFKACPRCKYPIQKNGGCSHMVCVCGCQYCWLCGKEYVPNSGPCHTIFNPSQASQRTNYYRTQKAVLDNSHYEVETGSTRSKLYVRAVENRNALKAGRLSKWEARALSIANGYKSRAAKGDVFTRRKGQVMDKERVVKALVDQIQDGKNITEFCRSIIYTLRQVHHIAEHIYVWLQDDYGQALAMGAQQLEFVAGQIYMILERGYIKGAIEKLKYIQESTEKLIYQIAKHVKTDKGDNAIQDSTYH